MADAAVRFDLQHHVATITLNRPDALNAMTADLSAGLMNALRRVRGDDAIRVGMPPAEAIGRKSGGDHRRDVRHRTPDRLSLRPRGRAPRLHRGGLRGVRRGPVSPVGGGRERRAAAMTELPTPECGRMMATDAFRREHNVAHDTGHL